jgi:HPt (histidine-containing phosphotransfer) domain-containing protein
VEAGLSGEQGIVALNDEALDIVDWVHFEKNRADLGPGFIRILSYFREDGAKSVGQIELAMHQENAAALVMPAHTIKGEARQFGAEPLAQMAELIESTARLCVETHRFPDELVASVVELRTLFEQTVSLFDQATNPLLTRDTASGFGRRAAANQQFGRI